MTVFTLKSEVDDYTIPSHFYDSINAYIGVMESAFWEEAGYCTAGACDNGPGVVVISIKKSLPEAPGAIAYHDEETGMPRGCVGLKEVVENGGTLADDVLPAILHEIAETIVDASCNLYAQDNDGNFWAKEVCDPVQEQTFKLASGVKVPNFVTHNFFDTQARASFDYMNLLDKPFTIAKEGYAMVYEIGKGMQTLFGEKILLKSFDNDTKHADRILQRIARSARYQHRIKRVVR